MKTEVEGESTGSWTPIVRRSSLDDFRRSLQSFQDSFEGLNAAESPLQTPITTTQITCSKYAHFANSLSICLKKDGRHSQRLESGLDPLKRVFGRCRSQQSGTNRDATYKTRAVSDRYMFHAFFRLLSSSLVESSSIDSSSAVVCTNKVQIKSECIVQGIYKCVCSGEDYMECFMPRDGFFAPMYDTVVSPIRYNLEQARGLTTSYWPTFNDGFYFPSQEDNASLTTQGTFLNTPFDEMEALTGRNLHNRCFTASKSCPSSLQPISTVLTPPGQKQMLRRVRSEKTHLMTPIKKRMNKSKQRPTQTMIKYVRQNCVFALSTWFGCFRNTTLRTGKQIESKGRRNDVLW